MPSTDALLEAYGNILIPDRIDEMTYRGAARRGTLSAYEIRQALMRLYERDSETIKDEK